MKLESVGLSILFLAGVIACGRSSTGPELSAGEQSRAQEIYVEQGCPVCHGEGREGVEDTAPALADLDEFWSVDRMSLYLEDPESFKTANPAFDQRRDIDYPLEMPAYGEVPEADRRLLARWLLDR